LSAAPPRSSPRPGAGTRLAAAVVVATLLFGRQIAAWTDPKNRYLFHWQSADGVALLLGIGLLALGILAVEPALARSAGARRHRLHEIGFLALFTHALLAQIQGIAGLHSFWAGLVLWVGILTAIRRLLRRGAVWPLSGAVRACLILSPLLPILALQILSWPAVDLPEPGTAPAGGPSPSDRPPVVVLVFDEWSWPRSQQDGRVRASLPHLAELAGRSLVASHAVSPGDWTWVSLPGLLFGGPGELAVRRGGARWIAADGSERPTREVPSLLDLAERHGYRGRLLGYYFPYRELLGAEGVVVRAYAKYPKGDNLAGAVGLALLRNLEFWSDPISQAAWEPLDAWLSSENWREVNQRLRADVRRELAAIDDGVLLFAHLPMPHSPFVFDRDGNYLGPYAGERSQGTPEQYEEQLRFADRVLGESVQALRDSGRFERALLIVTSDHSWRHDVEAMRAGDPLADRWVPLLVKWPHQSEPLVAPEPFCTVRLAPLLEAVMRSADPGPLTRDAWERLAAGGRAAAPCGVEPAVAARRASSGAP